MATFPIRRRKRTTSPVPERTAHNINLSEIQNLGEADLFPIRFSLGLEGTWNTIEIPTAWLPPGGAQYLAQLRIRARLVPYTKNRADLQLAVRQANRYLVLCFVAKECVKSGNRLLSMTTVMRSLESFVELLQRALARPPVTSDQLLNRLSMSEEMPEAHRNQLARVSLLASRGLWTDCPIPSDFSIEPSRRGQPKRQNSPPQSNPFLPLPDDFIANAGWRLAWITRTLGPSLVSIASSIAKLFENQELLANAYRRDRLNSVPYRKAAPRPQHTTTLLNNLLAEIRITDPNGSEIHVPPEALLLPDKTCVVEWPPHAYSDIKLLLQILQVSHLFIFLLSSGGRIGETLSLEDDCIVESSDGICRANGRTYKLVLDPAGAAKDWPLPELAVHAVRLQAALSHALSSIGRLGVAHHEKRKAVVATKSIWKRVGKQGAGFRGTYNNDIQRTVNVLQLDQWLDDKPITAHRFRKTVARLIALAMVDAPKILMDLYGHKNIEMTLHYILTDSNLASEITAVTKAQVILRAKEFITHVGELGGPAAPRIQRAVAEERRRIGPDFGEEDLARLAETFTFSGRFWQLVRPGILCTKGPHQAGPCNKSVGTPEPGRCRSECMHRLEEGFLREDTDLAIAEALGYLEDALKREDEIGAEMWRGQLITHLQRFPDLAGKWQERMTNLR